MKLTLLSVCNRNHFNNVDYSIPPTRYAWERDNDNVFTDCYTTEYCTVAYNFVF